MIQGRSALRGILPCFPLRRSFKNVTANTDLTKNSKLQAVIISLEVLIGTDELGTFQANLAEKRRLMVEEEVAPRVYDTSNEIKGISTVQTKYMDKIKQRLGKRDATRPIPRGKGDASLLQSGKAMVKMVASENRDKAEKGGSSAAWLLQLGMGNLLDYLVSRSVSIGLFSTFNSSDKLMQDFLAQVQLPFAHVEPSMAVGMQSNQCSKDEYAARRLRMLIHGASEANGSGRGSDGGGINTDNPGAFRDIQPKSIMVVSTDDSLLKAAREEGMLTCKYRLPNGLRGQVSCHFNATAALEIQDALEELNGIAWRKTAHGSRSMF